MAKVYWWAWIGIVLLPHLGRCQTPVIFHSSLTAGVGDIIYLQGSDFGNSPYVQYSYDSSNWKSMPLVTTGQGVISAKIPATESRLPDILTLRVSSDNVNWSAPVFINKPIAFAFDTDVVAPGSSFRIFGRNLLFGRRPYVRFHDLKTNSDQFAAIDVTNSTHYFISAKAPSNIIPAHTYEVFVNNGYDGDSPTPVHTIVQEPIKGIAAGPDYWNLGLPWSGDFNFYGNVYNVKTDARLNNVFATGDGVADDTWAISHAIQVASAAGGGVVYLPDGSYTLHFANGCGITLLPRVVLQGSGKDRVQINYGYPVGTLGGYGVCFANQTGLADVTIQSVDTAEQWQWSGLSVSNTEVFLKRVAWNIGTSQAINFVNDDHVAIEDSTITQGTDDKFNFLGPLNVQGCSRCEISNNSINFSVGGQIFDNASDLVFENNSVTRDISVSPNPATVTHSIAANFVKNLVVMNNTFSSLGNGVATNNDGEVLETEAGGPHAIR